MANYAAVKAHIDADIKRNGQNAITGNVLNGVLNEMVDVLGQGYQFQGVAHPSDVPEVNNDSRVCYLAGPGTYAGFGSLEVPELSVGILKYDGIWHVSSSQIVDLTDYYTKEQVDAEIMDAIVNPPYIDEATGDWFTWDKYEGKYVNSGVHAQGPEGERGPAGVTSVIVEVSESTGTPSATASVDNGVLTITFSGLKGETGNGIQSVVQTTSSQESGGENVITVTMTDGTVATFSVRNGQQGAQGIQGVPGVANAKYKQVDSLPTASADTMDYIYLTPSGTSGVYNMSYTEQNGSTYTWKDLGTTAIQLSDYATKEEVNQLAQEVNDLETDYEKRDYLRLSRGLQLEVGSFTNFSAGRTIQENNNSTTRARTDVLRTPLKITLNSGYGIRSYGTINSPDGDTWASIVSVSGATTLVIPSVGYVRLVLQKGSGSSIITEDELPGIVQDFYSLSDYTEYEKGNNYELYDAKNEALTGSLVVGGRLSFNTTSNRATMIVKIPCEITLENGYHFRNILLHNSINKDSATIEKIVVSAQSSGDPYAYISDPDYKYATVIVQKDGDGDFLASACNMKVYPIAPLTYNVKSNTKTNVPTSSYEQGGIGTNGNTQDGTTRVRVMLPLENNYLFGLNDKTNYRYFTRVYSENEMSSTYYLGTLSGQTENHDITKEEVFAKYPTAKYLAIVVRNTSNTDLSPAEYLFVVGGYTQVNGFVRLEDEKEDFQNNPVPHSLPLEHGSIIYDGTMSTKNGTANFLTTWRTPNFIELQDFSILTSAGSGTIFLYDSNYNLVDTIGIVGGTTMAVLSGNFPQCKFFKITIANPVLPSVTFSITNYSEVKNISTGAEMSFVYSVVTNNLETDATQLHKDETEYFDNGFLRLPPNYSNTGKKTRLILFAHGSGDFTNMFADTMCGNGGPYDEGYNPYFDYLNKEGYAIFDCWGMTSKFWALSNSFRSAAWGTPTNMASITAAYKWLVRHYNLYNDGIFVCGKSLGGLISVAMMFQHSVPVLAVASFAGDIDAIRASKMGYAQVTRQQNIADLKFDSSSLVSRFIDPDQADPLTDAEFYQMLLDNKDHLAGYAPYISNIIDKPYGEVVPVPYSNAIFETVMRLVSVPFKAWHSADDSTVPITQSRTFVQSIKNAGGIAELRVLPDGTGGHHSTDYGTTTDPEASGYSLKTDITTILGYECEDIPFAFIEFVEWIRLYE